MAATEWAREVVAGAYLDHAEVLRRRALSLSRDPATADDLVQEAFIRLLVEIDRNGVPDNIGGWLNRVATNLFISQARHGQVASRTAPSIPRPAPGPSPEDEASGREAVRSVHAAMRLLGPDDRTAIGLAAGGSSRAEIGARLGRTELATRALLSRARGRLRLRLAAADAR